MEAAQLAKSSKDAVPQSLSRARRGIRAPLLGDNLGSHADDDSRVQEYPEFEKQFGLPPGADVDAVLQEADKEAEIRNSDSLPTPPPGVRVGSPAYHLFREEGYQIMRSAINQMRHQLREFNEQKRQQSEAATKKEVVSAAPSSTRLADSA